VVLGFDAEWVSHHGKVSLLQFATEDACLLVQLGCLGNGPWPASLLRMLSDRALLKVGVGVAGDAKRLALSYATTFAGFHDAGLLANRHFGRTRGAGDVQRNPMGLANLSERMCGVSLPKNSRIRCSNWAKRKLSRTQMEYAALDAVAGREVFLRLAEEGALPCKEDQLYAWVDELLLGNEEEDTEAEMMGSSDNSDNSASGSGVIGASGSGANRTKDSANSTNDSGVSVSVNGSSAGANGSDARSVNGSNVAGMNGQLLTNGANRVNSTNGLGGGGGMDRIVGVGGIVDAGLGWEGRSGATSEKKASLLSMESDDIMLHYLSLKRRRHRLSAAADTVIANAAVANAAVAAATVAAATAAGRQCDRGEAQDEAALGEDGTGTGEDAEGRIKGFVAEVGAPLRTLTTMEWVEYVGDELGLTVSRSVWVEESKVSKVGEAPHTAPHLFVAQVDIRGTGTIAEERASTMARAQEMAALKAAQYLLLNAKRSSCVSGFGSGGDFESRMGSEEWWHAPFGFDSSRGGVGGVGGVDDVVGVVGVGGGSANGANGVDAVDAVDAVDVLSPLFEKGQLDIDVWTSASDTGGGTRDGTRGGNTLQERPLGAKHGTTSSSPSFPSSPSSSSPASLSLWKAPTHHAEVRLGGRTVGSASWCDREGAEAAAMARAVETLQSERLVYGYQKGVAGVAGVAGGGATGGREESGGAGGAGQVQGGGRAVGEGGARQRQVLEWFEQ
jgi:hypothetical protein